MAELLEHIGILIQQIVGALGYPGIFLASFAENLFPPIPSELIMPFGGFLVATGQMSFLGIVVSGTVGTVVGAVVIYYIGRWADERVVRQFLRRYGRYFQTSERDLDRALAIFQKY